MNDIKFAVDFVCSLKEAAVKDLKRIEEFENHWSLCSGHLYGAVNLPNLNNLIEGLKSRLEKLNNDPINTLLEDSPNEDEGAFNFYFTIDCSDTDWLGDVDWSNTILNLAGYSLEVLNKAGVQIGWNSGSGPNDWIDLSY